MAFSAILVASALLATYVRPGTTAASAGMSSVVAALSFARERNGSAIPRSFRFRYMRVGSRESTTGVFDIAKDTSKITRTDRRGRLTTSYFSPSTAYIWTDDGWRRLVLQRPPSAATKDAVTSNTARRARVREAESRGESAQDELRDGRRFTTYRYTSNGAPSSPAVTCLFWKVSGYIHECDSPGSYRITFDHYNDPSNVVTIPVSALRAPEL
jgi:hypothetical protein